MSRRAFFYGPNRRRRVFGFQNRDLIFWGYWGQCTTCTMRELVCQYTLRVYSLTNNIYLWECMQIKRTTFLTVLLVYIQLLFFQSWSNYIYQYNKLHTIANTKLRIHAQLDYQGLVLWPQLFQPSDLKVPSVILIWSTVDNLAVTCVKIRLKKLIQCLLEHRQAKMCLREFATR